MNTKVLIKKIYHRIMFTKLNILLMANNNVNQTLPSLDEAKKMIENGYTAKNLLEQKIPPFLYEEGQDGIILSLIVPVYNEEKNIIKCMETLINQDTSFAYELIVLNNASIDNSPKILEEYKKFNNVHIITIEENHGGSVARNVGITFAKGMYIGFIDSDDRVSEHYVQRLVETALNEDADIVKCGFAFEESSTVIRSFSKEPRRYLGGMGEHILEYDGYIWDAIYKRKLWKNLRFPEDYWYEDIIIKFLIFRMANKFVYIPDVLYYYYINPASTSKKQNRNTSLKCFDQYYLVKYCLGLSSRFGIKNDSGLYRLLLHELGDILFRRIKYVDIAYKKALFVISADIVKQYKKKYLSANYSAYKEDGMIEQAFMYNNFRRWELATQIKYHKTQI